MGGEYLERILATLRLTVDICNTNIDDTVRACGPKTPDKEVATFICELHLGEVALNRGLALRQGCWLHTAATGLDERFVAYCRGSERLRGKGSEFITDLIVAQEDKTTLLALQTMADQKGRAATITQ